MRETVTVVAVDTFITKLRLKCEKAVDDIFIPLEIRSVVAILVIGRSEDQVAILVAVREVGVIAVLTLFLHIEGAKWSGQMELVELFKKWLREVKIATVGDWIPGI